MGTGRRSSISPLRSREDCLDTRVSLSFELYLQNTSAFTFKGQLPCKIVQDADRVDPKEYWNPERTQDHIGTLAKIGYSRFIPALRWSTDFRSPGPTPSLTGESEIGHSTRRQPIPRGLVRRSQMLQIQSDPELRKRLALISEDASLVSGEVVIQEIVDLDYRSYFEEGASTPQCNRKSRGGSI